MKVRPEPFICKKCKQNNMRVYVDMEHNCLVDYCDSCGNTVKGEDL